MSNRFLDCEVLKVRATGELLLQGKPYILALYTDTITGINYVKLYRYQLLCDTDKVCISHIDTLHPVRSYQYDELLNVDTIKDDHGYIREKCIPMTNDTVLCESDTVKLFTFTFLDIDYNDTGEMVYDDNHMEDNDVNL